MSEIVELQNVEAAWERLRTHLEWVDDFWLVFVFTNDPRAVDTLRQRTAALLGEASSFRAWHCSAPAEVDGMINSILGDAPVNVHWIDLVRFDDRHGQPGWGDAWGRMLHRLNERREFLRRRAPAGGLVFATTLDRLDASPGLAPDLWTIRNLVFRIESLPRAEREWDEAVLSRPIEAQRRESSRNVVLARQAVRAARARKDEWGLARALSALADTTVEEEAVAVREEAVAIYRRLCEVEPSVETRWALRRELMSLGVDLDTIGHREQALEATRESVELARALVANEPESFLPSLAQSLTNFGHMLWELGRPEDALAASQEAVELCRNLANGTPKTFLPDLAVALNNLGISLNAAMRREEALTVTQEAVEIRRDLAKQRPEAFLPGLAKSLNNLGLALKVVGRREEALAAIQEAVEIRTKLAAARPEAFLPDLAASLNNLGNSLNIAGRREEALGAIQHAVEIYRKLAEARPEAFLPKLANSLGVTGAILRGLDRTEQAVECFAEAIRAAYSLFESQPRAVANLLEGLAREYQLTCDDTEIHSAEDLAPILARFAPREA